MERSDQIGDLIAALAKAQGEFGAALKGNESIAFGTGNRAYKYADLAANISAVRPALSKHGIALMQFNESDLEHQTAIVTTDLHHGEQFISITAQAPAVGRNGFDVQSLGACWTYLRRYTLQAICGLASEDDDATDLAGVKNAPIQGKQPPQAQPPKGPLESACVHCGEMVPNGKHDCPQKEKPTAGVFEFKQPNLICVPTEVTQRKSAKSGKEFVLVVFNGKINGATQAICFDSKFWPALLSAKGKECMIALKANGKITESDFYISITDVLSIGNVPYQNGVPVQVTDEFNQERGHDDAQQ